MLESQRESYRELERELERARGDMDNMYMDKQTNGWTLQVPKVAIATENGLGSLIKVTANILGWVVINFKLNKV